MTTRLVKVLSKLHVKERRSIELIVQRILNQQCDGLDIKKLQGIEDIYRVRKGDLRIMYRRSGNHIEVIAIERRTSTTYLQ